jgi:putative Holliday junction resolvase
MPDEVSRPVSETILAFDFGEQRIGIAVGNTLVGIAHPLQTIDSEVTHIRFTQMKALIDEWQPALLLVGLPCYLEGQEHEMSRLSRRFARRLYGRFGRKVGMWDERLSSAAASQSLSEVGVKGRQQKPFLDEVAAQHILQHYLDTPHRNRLLIQP